MCARAEGGGGEGRSRVMLSGAPLFFLRWPLSPCSSVLCCSCDRALHEYNDFCTLPFVIPIAVMLRCFFLLSFSLFFFRRSVCTPNAHPLMPREACAVISTQAVRAHTSYVIKYVCTQIREAHHRSQSSCCAALWCARLQRGRARSRARVRVRVFFCGCACVFPFLTPVCTLFVAPRHPPTPVPAPAPVSSMLCNWCYAGGRCRLLSLPATASFSSPPRRCP